MEQDDDDKLLTGIPPVTSVPPSLVAQSGLGDSLLGGGPAVSLPGLAGALDPGTAGFVLQPGMADALKPYRGVLSPDDPSKLTDITKDPAKPTYLTPNWTAIEMNKPAPGTVLPNGAGLNRLIKFADTTGLNSIRITGGAEGSGHTQNSVHGSGNAIDVGVDPHLDNDAVRRAALAAGYTHGIYEIKPGQAPHWHLQYGSENIINAGEYDLTHGPIKTRDYTKHVKPPQTGGGMGN